jgi:hypothetical protein
MTYDVHVMTQRLALRAEQLIFMFLSVSSLSTHYCHATTEILTHVDTFFTQRSQSVTTQYLVDISGAIMNNIR